MTRNVSTRRGASFSRFACNAAVFALAGLSAALINGAPADARTGGTMPPALVVTNEPLPNELQSKIYQQPRRAPVIDTQQVMGSQYWDEGSETIVSRKIDDLRKELFGLQGNVSGLSDRLNQLSLAGQNHSAEYYANVATISTQLQSGTTPGNPRLIKRLSVARNSLEQLAGNVASLNDLAVEISNAASMAGFLLESARTTYSLSGAVEEDHVRLSQLEDSISNTVVAIDRMLNTVNDDITRTVAYLSTERNNLRTLSLGITTGDLFGKSLGTRPFSGAPQTSMNGAPQAVAPMGDDMAGGYVQPVSQPAPLASARPLVKIRFDKANVNYEQPVYMAVNEALQRYPNARFELVAVQPTGGNSAEATIESTRARRNAEKVLRSLTEMGVSLDRIDLSNLQSNEATTSEVHLYVR